MIIGGSKEKVIDNIKNAANAGRLNEKTETDDPVLTPEQSNEIVQKYLDSRNTPGFKLKCFAARGIANIFTRIINKDSVITGLDNIKSIKGGAIITCNHFNPLDNTTVRHIARAVGRKRIYTVARETNLAMEGIIGFIMNYADTIPISDNIHYTQKEFFNIIRELVNKGEWVLIYPEQEMWFNYRKPRTMRPGAYYYASKLNVPIISCFVEMQSTDIPDNEEFSKVRYNIHVLDTIYPDNDLASRENCAYMQKKDYEQKVDCYERVYNKKLDYLFDISDIAGYTGKKEMCKNGEDPCETKREHTVLQ